MEIEIFRMSPFYRDGGSRDEIITNIGIFKLVKKLRNPNEQNGFYSNEKRVEKETEDLLYKAMKEFLEVKKEKDVVRMVEQFNRFYNKYGYKAIKTEE